MSDEVSMRTRADEDDALRARIAELEATVARLTAPVTEEEAIAADFGQTQLVGRHKRVQAALTAFLERRMKG